MTELTPPEAAKVRRVLVTISCWHSALRRASRRSRHRAEEKTQQTAARPRFGRPQRRSRRPGPGEPVAIRASATSASRPSRGQGSVHRQDRRPRTGLGLGFRQRAHPLFDREGGFLGGWGGHGDGQFAFRSPEGLAISGNNLYVADTWNHRVVRYTLAGEWKGSVLGFMGPRGVAVGPDGSVWVADTGNHRVVKYDAALKNQEVIGVGGSEPGKFKSPVSIAFGPSGNVYITDAGNSRIQVLDKDGKYLSSWSIPWLAKSWQARLETDRTGPIYLSYPEGSEVLSFDRSGAPSDDWTEASGEKLPCRSALGANRKQGILYVADIANRKLLTSAPPRSRSIARVARRCRDRRLRRSR